MPDSLSSSFSDCFALLLPQRKPDQCQVLPWVHSTDAVIQCFLGCLGQLIPLPWSRLASYYTAKWGDDRGTVMSESGVVSQPTSLMCC